MFNKPVSDSSIYVKEELISIVKNLNPVYYYDYKMKKILKARVLGIKCEEGFDRMIDGEALFFHAQINSGHGNFWISVDKLFLNKEECKEQTIKQFTSFIEDEE